MHFARQKIARHIKTDSAWFVCLFSASVRCIMLPEETASKVLKGFSFKSAPCSEYKRGFLLGSPRWTKGFVIAVAYCKYIFWILYRNNSLSQCYGIVHIGMDFFCSSLEDHWCLSDASHLQLSGWSFRQVFLESPGEFDPLVSTIFLAFM